MIKLRMIRWAGNVARIWEKRNAYRFSGEIQKEKDD
jgi:hypothetical protein